jgi:hypothetical protein
MLCASHPVVFFCMKLSNGEDSLALWSKKNVFALQTEMREQGYRATLIA